MTMVVSMNLFSRVKRKEIFYWKEVEYIGIFERT